MDFYERLQKYTLDKVRIFTSFSSIFVLEDRIVLLYATKQLIFSPPSHGALNST
jgi:hypothetical protein